MNHCSHNLSRSILLQLVRHKQQEVIQWMCQLVEQAMITTLVNIKTYQFTTINIMVTMINIMATTINIIVTIKVTINIMVTIINIALLSLGIITIQYPICNQHTAAPHRSPVIIQGHLHVPDRRHLVILLIVQFHMVVQDRPLLSSPGVTQLQSLLVDNEVLPEKQAWNRWSVDIRLGKKET